MATKESRTFEILLNSVELQASRDVKNGKHLVTLELVCPRPLVASKSAVRTFKFTDGVLDCSPLPWVKKIYFKETVEFRFAICARVSGSMTVAAIENFMRYFAGTAFGVGGDAIEKYFGGYQGDIASIPFDYAKKKLVATDEPKIVAEGAVDLLPSEIDDSAEIEIPLCALRDVFKTIDHGRIAKEKATTGKKLVLAAGTVIGKARIQFNALK